jgi:hypothetical protein
MTNYTEENQKAEFIGGAIAGGCGLLIFVGIIIFLAAAFIFGGS